MLLLIHSHVNFVIKLHPDEDDKFTSRKYELDSRSVRYRWNAGRQRICWKSLGNLLTPSV